MDEMGVSHLPLLVENSLLKYSLSPGACVEDQSLGAALAFFDDSSQPLHRGESRLIRAAIVILV